MKKRTLIILMFVIMFTGCSLLSNPYKQQIEIHKMKIDQGKIIALTTALESARTERIGIERQYQKKIVEHNALITAYVRVTDKTPDDIRKENILSVDYMKEESDLLDVNYQKQVIRINEAYNRLFEVIEEQDLKIEALDAAMKDIEEAQRKIYIEASKEFTSLILGIFVIPSIVP